LGIGTHVAPRMPAAGALFTLAPIEVRQCDVARRRALLETFMRLVVQVHLPSLMLASLKIFLFQEPFCVDAVPAPPRRLLVPDAGTVVFVLQKLLGDAGGELYALYGVNAYKIRACGHMQIVPERLVEIVRKQFLVQKRAYNLRQMPGACQLHTWISSERVPQKPFERRHPGVCDAPDRRGLRQLDVKPLPDSGIGDDDGGRVERVAPRAEYSIPG